jgi:transcriptional regulator with XRE-family HTH domain
MQPTEIHKGKTPRRRHYIAEWAERYGVKKAEIARKTGADKSLVSKWFNDSVLPGEKYLDMLAEIFDTERDSLFRHPDEDWLAKFFRDRQAADAATARRILEAAFPKTGT